MRFLHSMPVALLATIAAAALFAPAARSQPSGSVSIAPVFPQLPYVLFAGRPLPVPDPALAPFRDPMDNELCVAPESLAALGISFRLDRRQSTVYFTGPEGRTASVQARRGANNRVFVPIAEVMEAMGGKCQWNPRTNTLHIRAILTSIDVLGGQLRIKATLPVSAIVVNDPQNGKVYVDVLGAELGRLPRTPALSTASILSARLGQFNDDTARLVLEYKETSGLAAPVAQPSTLLILNPLPTQAPRTAQSSIVIKIPPDPPAARPASTPKTAPPKPVPPALVRAVTVRRVDDRRAQIVVSADRAPRIRSSLSSNLLTLELQNAVLGAGADTSSLGAIDHPLLRAVQLVSRGSIGARLVVDLTRVVAYTVSPQGRTGNLIIDLFLPAGAGGRLAGKLVVVDAGHGAHDVGARGVIDVVEKNVNLAIAVALRDQLQELGANVYMTRSDDTFVTLGERSRIANRMGADFFVSVHSDSTRNRSISGSTVYYHKQISSCRALAHSIAARLEAMGSIPTKGIRSDSVLYNSGLSVLRNSQMVSVLVECGYMTNLGDVTKLVQSAMQQRIAQSIADGLRDYVEGNPDWDTRNVNPRPAEENEIFLPPLDSNAAPDQQPSGPDPINDTPAPPSFGR